MDFSKTLVMAHAGGRAHGKENSASLLKKIKSLPHDIVELDLRKSRDGVIFCYHGFPTWKFLSAFLFMFLSFKTIKKICSPIKLNEAMDLIPEDKIVFYDIKQRNIHPNKLHKICQKYPHSKCIAAFTLGYLTKFKSKFPNDYKYVYNLGFLNFKKGVQKCKKHSIDVFQIFRWQCKDKNIKMIKDAGLQYAINFGFTSKAKYKQLIERFGSVWFCTDELA